MPLHKWGAYGTRTYQRYAMFWPTGEPADHPGVIMFPGGGWVGSNIREHTGGKGPDDEHDETTGWAPFLAAAGFTVMVAGYFADPGNLDLDERGLRPVWPWPLEDVERAHDLLEYRSAGVVGALGNSAGAFMALALRRDVRRFLVACPALPQMAEGKIASRLAQLFGTADRSLWPTPEIPAGACFVHGKLDTVVPANMTRPVATLGASYIEIPGAGHSPHTAAEHREHLWERSRLWFSL
jgi:pimeloyl-ACP methyl ester carboxylesterase